MRPVVSLRGRRDRHRFEGEYSNHPQGARRKVKNRLTGRAAAQAGPRGCGCGAGASAGAGAGPRRKQGTAQAGVRHDTTRRRRRHGRGCRTSGTRHRQGTAQERHGASGGAACCISRPGLAPAGAGRPGPERRIHDTGTDATPGSTLRDPPPAESRGARGARPRRKAGTRTERDILGHQPLRRRPAPTRPSASKARRRRRPPHVAEPDVAEPGEAEPGEAGAKRPDRKRPGQKRPDRKRRHRKKREAGDPAPGAIPRRPSAAFRRAAGGRAAAPA